MENHTIFVGIDQPFWDGDEDILTPEAQRLHAAMEADQAASFQALRRQEERHEKKVARKIKRERVRWALVRVLRILAAPLRVFRASSAEAASRHRQEDDAGGDDEDPEPSSFLRRIWAAYVAYEREKHRVLDEFYTSVFNRLAALLSGGAR